MIYFLQDSKTYAIKIGYTSGSGESRASQLQTGNASELVLLAEVPGGKDDEAKLHKMFAEHHIRGEWFNPAPRLILSIHSLVSQKTVYDLRPSTPGSRVANLVNGHLQEFSILMSPLTVYLSGKIEGEGSDWRRWVFINGVGGQPRFIDDGRDGILRWNITKNALMGGHTFCGPYSYRRPFVQGSVEIDRPQSEFLSVSCRDAIRRCDLVFAWISEVGCYEAIAEIGYAAAIGKPVIVAGPKKFPDLWFIYQLSCVTDCNGNGPVFLESPNPADAFMDSVPSTHDFINGNTRRRLRRSPPPCPPSPSIADS